MDGGTIDTFRIIPYEPRHLRALTLQPGQSELADVVLGTPLPERVMEQGPCWTAIAGHVIACAGFREEWPGRSTCWAALSGDAGQYMVHLTRAVRRALEDHPAERIETTVLEGFEPGFRWAKLLGFEDEGARKRYCRGKDHRAFVFLK